MTKMTNPKASGLLKDHRSIEIALFIGRPIKRSKLDFVRLDDCRRYFHRIVGHFSSGRTHVLPLEELSHLRIGKV